MQAGFDRMVAVVVFSWNVIGSLADMCLDILAGRPIPEPDLKTVAEAPQPGAVSRLRPAKTLPRATRGKVPREHAA
jgi:hypothetical protein